MNSIGKGRRPELILRFTISPVPETFSPPPQPAITRGPGTRAPLSAGFLLTVLASGGTLVINFATGILAARLLGPVGRGHLAAIQAVPLMIASVSLFGLPGSVAFFSAREPLAARAILTTGITTALAIALFASVVGWISVPVVLHSASRPIVNASLLFLLYIPLQSIQFPFVGIAWGLRRFREWNALRLLAPTFWLLTLLYCAFAGIHSAPHVSNLYLAGYALTIPIAVIVVRAISSGLFRVEPHRTLPLLRYGAPSALATMPGLMNLRLDQVLMAALLPASQLGLYAVAVSWSSVINPLLAAAGSTLFPTLASASPQERQGLCQSASRLGLVTAILCALALALITPFALPLLFGSPFASVLWPAEVLLLAGLFMAYNSLLEDCLRGIGATRWPLYGQLAGLPLTIFMLALLLKRFGIMGGAIASLLSYFTSTVVLLLGLRKELSARWKTLLLPRSDDFIRVSAVLRVALRTSAHLLSRMPRR